MEISGRILREVEFRDRLRGYDTDEVDGFLEKVAGAVDELTPATPTEPNPVTAKTMPAVRVERLPVQASTTTAVTATTTSVR